MSGEPKPKRQRSGTATSAAQPATSPGSAEPSAAASTHKRSSNAWLRAWAWKREHRPDKVRFERPYLHPLALPGGEGGAAQQQQLTVHQQRFRAEGFASTVWDSSIVLAKYFERHAGRYAGARCLDLSAGCGLPGLVLARLGARVTATDLSPNLPLLEKNAAANGLAVEVREHTWGADVAALAPPFDVISACDCMYVAEAIEDLVRSLVALSGPATEVLIAHGRNRQAEPQFLEAAARHFTIEAVGSAELDELYQCVDVDVMRLRRKPVGERSGGDAGESKGISSESGQPAGLQQASLDGIETELVQLLFSDSHCLAHSLPQIMERPENEEERRPAKHSAGNGRASGGGAVTAGGPLSWARSPLEAISQPAALNQLLNPSQQPATAAAAGRAVGGGRASTPLHPPAPAQPRAPHAQPLPFSGLFMGSRPFFAPLPSGGGGSQYLPPRAAAAPVASVPPPLRPPDWPACSPCKPRQPSEEESSPRGPRLHVLAADMREAAASGGRLSKAAENVLILTSGGVVGAALAPALATANRKTELDLDEPPAPVAVLVSAFEELRGRLAAAGEARALLVQEGWTAVLGRALGGGASVLQRSMARMLQPAFAGARLAPAREALRTCALQADAALAGLSREAAAVVALEAVQRCAVRASLPLYGARAGLYLLPAWLERPVWQQHPSLAPAGLAGAGCHRTADCGRAVEAALAHLAAAHEAVEEAMRGTPEPERQAVCGGVLAAAAAAVLAPHLPSGEAQDLLGLRCLEALQGSGAAAARHHVEAALQALASLQTDAHKVAAAAEVVERGAGMFRLPGAAFGAVLWSVLRRLL